MTDNTEALPPLPETMKRAYYYTDLGGWRGPEVDEDERWLAVAEAARAALAQPSEPLKRGITGTCTRSTCECESNGLGLECIWLRPTDAELERRTGEPHIDGWPLYSGLPPAQPSEPAAEAQESAPPRAAPLTDEQIAEIMRKLNRELSGVRGWGWLDVARAIERAHGISTPKEK